MQCDPVEQCARDSETRRVALLEDAFNSSDLFTFKLFSNKTMFFTGEVVEGIFEYEVKGQPILTRSVCVSLNCHVRVATTNRKNNIIKSATLYNKVETLLGVSWNKRSDAPITQLNPGKHVFPFRFVVPAGEASFDTDAYPLHARSMKARVLWTIQGTVDTAQKVLNHKGILPLRIGGVGSLARNAEEKHFMQSAFWREHVMSFKKEGSCVLKVLHPAISVAAGAQYPIHLEICNDSPYCVEKIEVSLKTRMEANMDGHSEGGFRRGASTSWKLANVAPDLASNMVDLKIMFPEAQNLIFPTAHVRTSDKWPRFAFRQRTFLCFEVHFHRKVFCRKLESEIFVFRGLPPFNASPAAPPPYSAAVASSPPRISWIPDSPSCCLCSVQFSFTRRRHHCRVCGACICAECATQTLKPELGQKPVWICSKCIPFEKKSE